MNDKFFFVTTYDGISASLLTSILNDHADFHCSMTASEPFLISSNIDSPDFSPQKIDEFVQANSVTGKKFNGNVQHFSAYELWYNILAEKAHSRLRIANIAINPRLRINLLMRSWLESKTTDAVLHAVKNDMYKLSHHSRLKLYKFFYFYNHIVNTAKLKKIDFTHPHHELFLIALAKVITHDTADLPIANKTFSFEKLISHEDNSIHFLNYLSHHQIELNEISKHALRTKLQQANDLINTVQQTSWEDWQTDLLNNYLEMHLQTVYYPHINKPLSHFYALHQYPTIQKEEKNSYSKLISIQLNSNRPAQLSLYFDNLEETADHPNEIEVLININDDDQVMEKMLIHEASHRPFTIKYIKSPKPKSFCDLWEPINRLLTITDQNAYFLLNISDEMLFATKGWDTILKKYIGIFPDHLFRLRASRNKFRNYFDRWECSFAQDSIPITTKRWIDIGGNWNPCFGPDSFQQLISFYLSKSDSFSNANYLRELPLLDIQFQGDIPGQGIDAQHAWKINSDHIKAMQVCQSYKMQQEAKRRAMLIKAHIYASLNHLSHYEIIDAKSKKDIQIIDKKTNKVICSFDYHLNRLPLFVVNQWRKLRFDSYFGGGRESKRNMIISFAGYLRAKYAFFYHLSNSIFSVLRIMKIMRIKRLFRRLLKVVY